MLRLQLGVFTTSLHIPARGLSKYNDLVKCAEKKIHNFFLIIWDNTADKFIKLYLSLVLFKMVIEQSNTQDQLMSEVTYYRQ